ncbi:selenoneine synthase SenA [Ideonella sp. BN130291]|uniref:selenoneine synthase SenA n=1 Tax=Ideonella sp. BN130291 TaxID=3112940 RepID=UPI002E252738|nr:selenoneine synthase SenA [Ideonella sp. BN130291]
MSSDARTLTGDALVQALQDSRRHTLALVADLDDAQWQVPQRAGLNPLAWELAHIAWFAEFWILRGPHRADASGRLQAAQPFQHAGPDELLDSARLPHAQRWRVALPSRARVLGMLAAQLDACLAALPAEGDDAALYFHRLALFHEDMHGEALTWLRASLGYAAPPDARLGSVRSAGMCELPGGALLIGWPAYRLGFAFDNEQPARTVPLQRFRIDRAPVSAGAYARFVDAGGYAEAALWPAAAANWRARKQAQHPARWRRAGNGWETRWFDRWLPLQPAQPAIHLNAWESEAYARWAGRRLPSAAEWEHAARSGQIEWGRSVWEWTADAFQPYPGFQPGPYRDYSAPWFGDHRELRGGAFATQARLHDPVYRNFFLPDRTDLFTGFRTVEL